MSSNWIFLPLLACNENVMGGREVPIHLELNSVASRASRAAIHPAAGSCCSPGDATGGLAPTATLGKGENTRAWTDTRGVGVRTAPGFSLRVVPMACWGGGFLATGGVRAVHGGALPGGGAGIPCPWPWPDTGQDTGLRALHFPGSCRSRGGAGGAGKVMSGRGWQGPNGKRGSHGSDREGSFPGKQRALFLMPTGFTPASSSHSF